MSETSFTLRLLLHIDAQPRSATSKQQSRDAENAASPGVAS
jgi:hypothetical protein